jgi:hypothetical protein
MLCESHNHTIDGTRLGSSPVCRLCGDDRLGREGALGDCSGDVDESGVAAAGVTTQLRRTTRTGPPRPPCREG